MGTEDDRRVLPAASGSTGSAGRPVRRDCRGGGKAMSVTIFARQQESVGLYGGCEDARVEIGETRGQEGWEEGINYTTLTDLISQINQRIGSEHILALGISCHGSDAPDPQTFGGVAI